MIRVDGISPISRKPDIEILPVPSPAIPLQAPLAATSSITPSSEIFHSTPLRPQLAAPDTHYMYAIFKFYKEMERLAGIESQTCDRETKIALDHLKEIDKQKIELVHKHSEEIKLRGSWSYLEIVAQYITSSSSFFIGLALSSTVPIAGGFLIAAGGLGLINRAMSDSGMWEWLVSRFTASFDLQIKIASQIDTCTYALSILLSIASTVGLYNAGVLNMLSFSRRDKILEKSIQVIGSAGTAMQVITRLGGATVDRAAKNIEANIKLMEKNSFSARQQITASTANLRKIIDLSEKISECIKQIIHSSPI